MANLKLDLIGKINNEKYYSELELVRLAQEPSMNYEEKIESISIQLENLALLNAKLGLIDQYFQEPAPEQQVPQQAPPAQPVPQQQPAPNLASGQQTIVQNGQTHGE